MRRSDQNAGRQAPLLTPFGEGVWLASQPVRILGTRLTTTMAVLRLAGDDLLLFSPIALTARLQRALEDLGRIAHLYTPNLFHHLSIGEWSAAYPEARLHAPAGLAKKRPDLEIDRVHGNAKEPAFEGVIDELPIAGFRLAETVLYYRPAKTLVVADLVHNVGRPEGTWTRIYAQAMGFYDRVALSRAIRWTAWSDKAAARKSLDGLLALPIERLVVGHGAPIDHRAPEALANAFGWLPA